MTPAWMLAPQGKAAQIAQTCAAIVPAIETARLRLRLPKITDYPSFEAVFTSDRARHIGGPFDAEEAFSEFCQGIAGWVLRGAGMWTLTTQADDAPLGWIYLWQEMGDPEPELGWVLTAEAEGNGFAFEAAMAVLPHALALFGAGGFVSYIGAKNERSAQLALSLGARRDPVAEADATARGDFDLHVYRHSGTGVSQ